MSIPTTVRRTITNSICTPGADGCTLVSTVNGALNIAFANPGGFLQIAVRDTATLVRVSGFGQTLDLNSFVNQFDQTAETPEPATLGLMGSALAGLLFFARRRRS